MHQEGIPFTDGIGAFGLPFRKADREDRKDWRKPQIACILRVRQSYQEEIMYDMAITSVSTKGQVVIPEDIRKLIGLEPGTKMMVLTDGSNVMLKPIAKPSMEEFEEMAKATRQFARRKGLKRTDVKKAIKKVRGRAHRS